MHMGSNYQHEIATKAKQKFYDEIIADPSKANIEFQQDDILNTDLHNATHIYIASLCFPPRLMKELETKIVKECSCNSSHKNHHVGDADGVIVATLQRFPNDLRSRSPQVQYMEMSWTKPFGCPVYLYRI